MIIGTITDGIVIDHIPAGRAMELYGYLNLDKLDCEVALIKNAPSEKYGRKDILKIDDDIDIDLDVLGYLDPGITVNIIEDGRIREKKHLALPERLTNVIRCRNPRCITTTESSLDQVFRLVNPAGRVYRCVYCDAER